MVHLPKPILWHIMQRYSLYGINDFIICCGYKGHIIKEYFESYSETLDQSSSSEKINKQKNFSESWNVTVVDTGLETMTGGRLKRVEKYLDEQTFCFTYGDTLNDLNISNLIAFHRKKKKMATVTACQPLERFGILKVENDQVLDFKEKPRGDSNWVNGGYFVLEHDVIEYIQDDSTVWEDEPLKRLVKGGQLSAYKHTGFYQPMDTILDKNHLEKLWNSGKARWKD